jgi:hypothetical protein
MPDTVHHWAAADREGFGARYRQAREIGYETMADQILDGVDDRGNDWIARHNKDGSTDTILDPDRVSRPRLRFEARRWLLSKALPKIYGDRLDLNARHEVKSDLAEVMRVIDGRTRGLPSQHRPLDDDEDENA